MLNLGTSIGSWSPGMLKLGTRICSGNARFRYLALASGEPGPTAGTQ